MAFRKKGTPQPATVLDKCSDCKKMTSANELEEGLCKLCVEKKKKESNN